MGPTVGLGQWPDMISGAPAMGLPQVSQAQCATALQQLYGWLQAAVPQAPQYANAVPATIEAVRLYRNGQYDQCLAQIQLVTGFIGRGGQPTPPQ
ncbi:hypothetical protein ACTMTF_34350 [Nonomuraea sp. ZG12]|jgi:hypothetical protein|uniref:hypothetical protein n=1 Tax=Nonomuraea sp. ZG12 TaxID=3452207 RepID=UPI003F8A03DA